MKKILLFIVIMFFASCTIACNPTSTQVSMNTNLTQSTTVTTVTNYVAVTHLELILDPAEVCVGDQVSLSVNITPTNATNQSFTITLSSNTYVDFVNPANQLLLEANLSYTEVVETTVTATSDDNPSIDDTQTIFVHPTGGGVC